LPGGNGKTQKNTPLLLKGRIFLGNVTQAVSMPAEAVACKCIFYVIEVLIMNF
jgi:hypothetical protein